MHRNKGEMKPDWIAKRSNERIIFINSTTIQNGLRRKKYGNTVVHPGNKKTEADAQYLFLIMKLGSDI